MMEKTTLTGRRWEIAVGRSGLPRSKVDAYRARWQAQGYDVPALGAAVPDPGRAAGPGTELKRLLKRLRIVPEGGCRCSARAAEMDRRGCAWCRDNIDTIVGWLREEAENRELPFREFAARQLVKLAIRRARRRERTSGRLRDTEIVEPNEAPDLFDGGFRAGDFRSPLAVYNRDLRPVPLNDVYHGASCFLVCSGPSLKSLDISRLEARGILSMAVNNAAALVRPQLWCCVDAPHKWIEQLWRDPGIWKFVPVKHFGRRFRIRTDGRLRRSAETIGRMPGVFGYYRNARFDARRWLTEPTFNWGCGKRIRDDAGVAGTRTVFLVALKLLYFLGVRTVYLLGADWHMREPDPYAFPQDKDARGCRGNNSLYRITRQRLKRLKPHFDAAGFHLINCTPGSRLDVFPTMSYERAVDTAAIRTPIDTRGLY